MAIAVKCGACGKELKAKDELAGKTVRCPGCQAPMRIGAASAAPSAPAAVKSAPAGAKSAPAKSAAPAAKNAAAPAKTGPDVEAALLKIEATRQKKAANEEEVAARQAEMNKLVGAWDQMAGKGDSSTEKKGDKKKDEKIGERATEVTIKTKVQDRVGIFTSFLWVKYLALAVLILGGGWASSTLVGRLFKSTVNVTNVPKGTEADIPRLYKEAREALAQGNYAACNDCLKKIVEIQPFRVSNIEYKEIKEKLEKAVSGG